MLITFDTSTWDKNIRTLKQLLDDRAIALGLGYTWTETPDNSVDLIMSRRLSNAQGTNYTILLQYISWSVLFDNLVCDSTHPSDWWETYEITTEWIDLSELWTISLDIKKIEQIRFWSSTGLWEFKILVI